MTVAINGRFLLNSFGGVRRMAIELTERLARLRGDVVLVVPRGVDEADLPDVPVERIGRFNGPLWEQGELPLWLRRHGSPLLLNLAAIAPIVYPHQISVLHDVAPLIRPHDFTVLFRVQWQLSVRFGMLRRGRALVTISDASRREIADCFHVDQARIEMIHIGADSVVAAPDAEGAEPEEDAYFLVFGRHGAAKNVRSVLDAVALLPPSSPVRLHLIGTLDPELRPYAAQKGVPPERIVWRGPVTDDELAGEYQRATGFVWPSLHEGFGLPPVEAQSLGVPVIASDIPINREILAESALFFPATDPAALASRMIEVAEDAGLASRLAQQGVENSRRFSWDAMASAWNELIRERGRR